MKTISKEALQAYHTLLKYSQLEVHRQIFFRNVPLNSESHIHEIYTKKTQNSELPHLVLLHGFAGSAMSYIRTFKNLSQHFNVHALDHFGNGFSSRPVYDFSRSKEEILHQYVDSIEQWRQKIGVQNMVLAGHSFGGYIAAHYMQKHQSKVDRLILLSPVGTSSQQDIIHQIQNRKSESLKSKLTLPFLQKIFEMNLEPSKIFKLPLIGNFVINQFLRSTIKLHKQEKQMWIQYIKEITEQESQLDKSFYKCFEWPFISKLTSISQILENIVQEQKKKSIEFYYGQNDWTESIAAKKISCKYSNVRFEIIPNATHNMIFDYPDDVSSRIINPLPNINLSQKMVML